MLEVSNTDYDSYSGSSPLATFNIGGDVVPLPTTGITHYFICGVPAYHYYKNRLICRSITVGFLRADSDGISLSVHIID